MSRNNAFIMLPYCLRQGLFNKVFTWAKSRTKARPHILTYTVFELRPLHGVDLHANVDYCTSKWAFYDYSG